MTAAGAEFSRFVPLSRIARRPAHEEIEACEEEREALARRFGLVALDRLSAVVELTRQEGGGILLEAAFEAAFVQSCVVTLEPVAGHVSERFALRYGPAEDVARLELMDAEDEAFEPLDGDAIDIGEAVAQELSLSLPMFPRHPDAALEGAAEDEPPVTPFSVLARLRNPATG